MKTSIKLISLILSMLMLLLSFAACTPADTGDTGTTSGDETTTGADTTTAPETTTTPPETTQDRSMYKDLYINGNNIKDYTIVAGLFSQKAAESLAEKLEAICGYDIPVVKESDSDLYIELYTDSSLGEGQGDVSLFDDVLVGTVYSHSGADALVNKIVEMFTSDADSVNLKGDVSETLTYEIKNYTSGGVDLYGDSLWNPLEYEVGETIPFLLTTKIGANTVTCPKIKYSIKNDDGSTTKSDVTVECVGGEYVLNVTPKKPGFFYVTAVACDASGKEIAGSKKFAGGAGAGLYDIETAAKAPDDFKDYWQKQVTDLLKINPDIIEMKAFNPTATHDQYIMRIKAVDDSAVYNDGEDHNYVSGFLIVPKNAAKKSLKIQVYFNGYGISKLNHFRYEKDTIFFNVIAHGIDAFSSVSNYYKNYENGALKNYGMNSVNSPDKVYFKNMLLRDLQAVRWITEHYGAEGEDLWNGRLELTGGSQGGMQSIGTGALCGFAGIEVDYINTSVVWMCDLRGFDVGRNANQWWRVKYDKNSTAYFDSAYFGAYVDCPVDITYAGMGDPVSPPAAIMSLYNNLSGDKSIVFVQNGGHGSANGAGAYTYKLTDKAE